MRDAGDEVAPGGDLLAAYDAEVAGMSDAVPDLARACRAVLLLARSGAAQQAEKEFERFGLNLVTDDERIVSLGARLLKDRSLGTAGEERRRLARAAADRYASAYALKRGFYPGINVATMLLLANERPRAQSMAREVLAALPGAGAANAEEAYYLAATEAEAHTILGDLNAAAAALALAVARDPHNISARAGTLRQLQTILQETGAATAWLEKFRPPMSVVYSGHMFMQSGAGALEKSLAGTVARLQPGAAFGALAAGADIAIAETILAHSGTLHVVLPMREEDFIARSVAPFGETWIARYHACRARAATFRLASHEPNLGDDGIFAYGADYAMGLAIRHAEMSASRAMMVAVWDGVEGSGTAGTAADVARWRRTGRPLEVIDCPPALRRARPAGAKATVAGGDERSRKAILFADVRGFSKLQEGQIRPFVAKVLGPLADAITALPRRPDLVATWGDGLHFVFGRAGDAAAAAVAAQRRFAEIDLLAAGLPDHLALRIGGHFGPVSEITDPFLGSRSFFGTHITIAARIEPVALPGSIYVSEPFAAALALEGGSRFRSDYVGQTELPKKFGSMRLFSLRDIGA
ncbi:MAG: tetratricopeptide repeat-containing protein [Rhodospirillaceae bacterium]